MLPLLCTCIVLSFALLLLHTSGPPSSVLLEYFRYYTRAHALLYYDSKPEVYANHILDFLFYFFLTSKPLTLQVSDAAGLDL